MNPFFKRLTAASLAAVMLGLSACGAPPAPPSGAAPSHDGIPPETLHILGLTAEEKMEDYEYFWSTLRDSYPCWGILERQGVDVEAIYEEYKELAVESDSDVNFFSALYSALWRLGRNGHLWMVEPAEYTSYPPGTWPEGRSHWASIWDSAETQSKYDLLKEMDQLIGDVNNAPKAEYGEAPGNVSTLLLPESGVGYLKILSFGGDMTADGNVLSEFFRRCAGYGDLIIDLTENSGGSEYYWEDLLVAPLIDRILSNENVALVRMSDNNRPFLEEVFRPDEILPLDQLPDLPNLASNDRDLATHFVRVSHTVEPAAARSPFRGRIWVLVSDAVYSASESFAMFCQDTDFATLVGNQTGGDGIGIDPIFLQLPNSGILVQYTALFGLNADGGSNEEYGTTPDIVSPTGETPLITALRAIETAKLKG